MNEKKARPPRASSKTKNKRTGFYAALYSCVGVMLVTAVIIGVSQLGPSGTTGDATANRNTPTPTARPIPPATNQPSGQDDPQDITQPTNRPITPNDVGNVVTPTSQPGMTPPPIPTGDAGTTNQTVANDEDYYLHNDETVPVFGSYGESLGLSPYDGSVIEMPDSLLTFEEECCHYLEAAAQYQTLGFTAFNDGDRMTWPVPGEIIMEYSTTALIFNPTLWSWRVNPNVAIESPIGTQVAAAAAGRITEVTTTRELGRTITIDHGNGWSTTYSQLQANVRVGVGDVVIAGQVIGYVGEPSAHSSALAPHVAFQVFQDNATVNPRTILSAR